MEKNIETKKNKWKEPLYGQGEVKRAGKTISTTNHNTEDVLKAMDIINNWRASHAYPLHVIYMQLRRMTNTNKSIIVAERLKRMDSIVGKLSRYPSMNLWRIQD